LTENDVKQVSQKKRTSQEFRINAQIGEYDIDNIVLDLGSNVNVIPKRTWELMGNPKLVWSPIALKLANQQKIIPFGRLELVWIDIEGVRSIAAFEVIEIVYDSIPYPALLGYEWAFENLSIVNLKKRQLVLEQGDLRVIAPLDPKDGRRYVETIKGGMVDEGIDSLYKVTARTKDYINSTIDGNLSWRRISSYTSDTKEGLENWQQRLHEVSIRICACITRSLRWIGMEV